MSNNQPGWDQYSTLVLKQLESLSSGIEGLRAELQGVKQELVEIKAKGASDVDRIKELREWKEKVDDVASPNQLKAALDDVAELKTFKTKAVTVFAVVQFVMAGAIAFANYLNS